jgi:hypothetical protein
MGELYESVMPRPISVSVFANNHVYVFVKKADFELIKEFLKAHGISFREYETESFYRIELHPSVFEFIMGK